MLEIVFAVSIMISAMYFLHTQYHSWQQYYFKNQLRTVAQFLASDLRQIQQHSLFQGEKATWVLKISASKAEYRIYNGLAGGDLIKKVNFQQLNCGEVYFQNYITRVTFNNNGTPSETGAYILKHKKLATFRCRLTLQPVTGRVSLYEEE